MIKFSIFLAVRNGWPYIQECVESILAQTYANFELVVLDNQSTDNTLPWLKTLTDKRVSVHVSTSPVSLSIVESWARIKAQTKNEYMTMVGHDDVFDPDFLATIVDLIGRYPDSALYQTGGRLINSEGKTIRSCRPVSARETAAQYLTARFTFQRDVFATGYVMRSADYDRLGGIPPFERLLFADDALFLSLMRGSYKANEPSDHFGVRIHAKSESASLPSLWSSILIGLNQFSDFLKNYSVDDVAEQARLEKQQAEFMLKYHRNAYIFALVEACQAGRKIDKATVDRITASLARTAPACAGQLRNSLKVIAIEALNTTPLRDIIPRLWDTYWSYRLRMRMQ